MYLSAHAFIYNRAFALVFLIGLIADEVLTKLHVHKAEQGAYENDQPRT